MDNQKVEMYLMTHGKFIESHHMIALRQMLEAAPDTKYMALQSLSLKDPTLILIVSLIAGALGIDRFMIGDTGLGLGKLLTCGGLGVWALVDLFLIMGRTREKNMEMIQMALAY